MTCAARLIALLLPLVVAACASQTAPPSSRMDLADTALANGAPQLALSIAQSELAQHPGDPSALLREGRAEVQLHQPSQAAEAYRQALAAAPRFVPALMELGKLQLGADPEQARALFQRAATADPASAPALNDLGIALDMLARHMEAQRSYRQALALDQDLVSAQVNLALSLAMTGNDQAALQLLQPIAQGPQATPRIRRDLALLLVRMGHEAEAQQVLQGDLPTDEAQAAIRRYRELGADAPLDAPH